MHQVIFTVVDEYNLYYQLPCYYQHYNIICNIGDLTDAKSKDKMGSNQILQEWKYYRSILENTNVIEKTLWLDVRGNHGMNFNKKRIKKYDKCTN